MRLEQRVRLRPLNFAPIPLALGTLGFFGPFFFLSVGGDETKWGGTGGRGAPQELKSWMELCGSGSPHAKGHCGPVLPWAVGSELLRTTRQGRSWKLG